MLLRKCQLFLVGHSESLAALLLLVFYVWNCVAKCLAFSSGLALLVKVARRDLERCL